MNYSTSCWPVFREMDDIVQGKKAAARVTEFPEPEVKLIREKVGLSQNGFAMLIGLSASGRWKTGSKDADTQPAPPKPC